MEKFEQGDVVKVHMMQLRKKEKNIKKQWQVNKEEPRYDNKGTRNKR